MHSSSMILCCDWFCLLPLQSVKKANVQNETALSTIRTVTDRFRRYVCVAEGPYVYSHKINKNTKLESAIMRGKCHWNISCVVSITRCISILKVLSFNPPANSVKIDWRLNNQRDFYTCLNKLVTDGFFPFEVMNTLILLSKQRYAWGRGAFWKYIQTVIYVCIVIVVNTLIGIGLATQGTKPSALLVQTTYSRQM